MHRRSPSRSLSGKIVRNVDEVLDNLQERLDNWKSNEQKVSNELSLYPYTSQAIIQTVNDRCDRMIRVVEEHRRDVLDEIERKSGLYTSELENQLKKCTQRVQSTQDLLTKCAQLVREDAEKLDETYQLTPLYTLIRKHESRVHLRTIFQPRFCLKLYSAVVKGMPWKKGYEGVEGGPGVRETIGRAIGDDACLDFKSNGSIYVDIPLKQQCQIVVENWCRKACGISNPPLLVIAAIDKFNPLGSIDESFIENHEEDASSRFIISQEGQQCTLREGTSKRDTSYSRYLSSVSSIFGTVTAGRGCKYHWKLHVMHITSDFFIGVVGNKNFDSWMFRSEPMWWRDFPRIRHYCYASDDGYLHYNGAPAIKYGTAGIEYGDSYGSGDIVEIVLDMRDGTIMFGKNGVFYGRHSVDLMIRERRNSRKYSAQTYRLAIGAYCWNKASVRLISCTRTGLLDTTDDSQFNVMFL